MWFAILGPLLVHDGEIQVDVPNGRRRVLLAALLMHTGNPVPAGALAEVVWDGSPPPGAEVTLRSHVLGLRRVLGPLPGPGWSPGTPGYLLQAGEDEVDVLRFRCLCRDGGTALREGAWDARPGCWVRRSACGAATAGGHPVGVAARDEGQELEELRLQAAEMRIEADLHWVAMTS